MGVCESTNKTHHSNKNTKGKTIDNKVIENKINNPKKEEQAVINKKEEAVVVDNNKPKENTVVDNNTNVVVNKVVEVNTNTVVNNNEVKENNTNVVLNNDVDNNNKAEADLGAIDKNEIIDAKDIAYDGLKTNQTLEGEKTENLEVHDKEVATNKVSNGFEILNTTEFTLTRNFVNTSVPQINYSAKHITKYYRDQEKYDNEEEFTDSLFPPTINSIIGLDENNNYVDTVTTRREDSESNFQINKDDIEWLRPREIFGPEYALFEGKIEFDDVRQGQIGNCYFMASISALTECPQILAEIFRQHKVQNNGRYEICMKLDGEWNVVIVDDLIPCNRNTKKPIFAKPKGNELWAILLEKAWAKVNGGYINTVAGNASEVIECLVNFPYEYNDNALALGSDEVKETLWGKIIQASSNEYIMTSALPSRGNATKELGLVEGHEYTLIEGREYNYNGNRIRLVKLRNPWGKEKYIGPWGAESNLWDDELKNFYNHNDVYNEDGEFYMSYDDFISYFGDVDICKIDDRICMKQSSISYEMLSRFNYKSAPKVFELHIHEESNVDITIFKPYYRFIRDLPSYWYIHQHLLIGKCEDESNLTFSEFWGNSEAQNDCTLSVRLSPGTYFIVAFVDFSTARSDDGHFDESLLLKLKHNINVCCSEFFEFHDKGFDANLSMTYRMIQSYNRNNPAEIVPKKLQVSKSGNFANSGFHFLYIRNPMDFNLELKLTYSNKLLKNWHSENVTNDPEANELIFVLSKNQEYLGVFSAVDIFEPHGLSFSYTIKKSNSNPKDNLYPKLLELEECPVDRFEVAKYVWIYKKTEVDYDKLVEKIDSTESIFKHLKIYYPNEIEEILEVPKFSDHKSLGLVVESKKFFDESKESWYLGEWRVVNNALVMWGRGMLYMNKKRFVGQFVNHSLTGIGKKYDEYNNVIQGNFVNFNPVGKCSYTKNDGRVQIVEYAS